MMLRTSASGRLRLCLQPLSPSSRHRLKQLMDKHGSGQIHQVTGTVAASRDLDLNLAKGELVAVISEADTRGDRRRWLVDAGGETSLSCALNRNRHESLCLWAAGRRGYAPSSKLIRYHQPAEEPPPSPHLTPPGGLTGVRRHSYTPEVGSPALPAQPCFQVMRARLTVLHPCGSVGER